jgi:hypothetical protein
MKFLEPAKTTLRAWVAKVPRWGWSVLAAMVALLVVLWGYRFSWTGFSEDSWRKRDFLEYRRAKTLWDWMGLLIVPVVLAVGGYWFTQRREDLSLITPARKKVKYEPEASARGWLVPAGIHERTRRARMIHFLAGVIRSRINVGRRSRSATRDAGRRSGSATRDAGRRSGSVRRGGIRKNASLSTTACVRRTCRGISTAWRNSFLIRICGPRNRMTWFGILHGHGL